MLQMILELADVLGEGVFSAVGGIIGWVVGSLASFIVFIASGLPSNPLDFEQFAGNLEAWDRGMSWLNWFVPVGTLELIMGAWVAATLVFYASRFVLRVVGKLVGNGVDVSI